MSTGNINRNIMKFGTEYWINMATNIEIRYGYD